MRRIGKTTAGAILLAAALMASSTTAIASEKYVDLKVDLDNTPTDEGAGHTFLPEFEVKQDNIDVEFGELNDAANNPTIPVTVEVKISAEDGYLDDDLEIRGTGIRSTYVDYVDEDNSYAEGRIQIYPFYQLIAPEPTVDYNTGVATWDEVPYAGKYEYVISYTKKDGSEKTSHGVTTKTSVNLSSEIKSASDGLVGIAVRAQATNEEGYLDASISEDGMASWERIGWAGSYKMRVSYTNAEGEKKKFTTTVSDTKYSVSGYLHYQKYGELKVTVRAVGTKNDAKYYNIALSEFGMAGGREADTSNYEVDNPWEFLADYSAVVEGDFAQNTKSTNASGTFNKSFDNGSWKRVGYRWQYLENGTPFNAGWKQIGNAWYFFSVDGYVYTGWLTDTDGKVYYLESKVGDTYGQMFTGTHEINGKSYTFNSSGALE